MHQNENDSELTRQVVVLRPYSPDLVVALSSNPDIPAREIQGHLSTQ